MGELGKTVYYQGRITWCPSCETMLEYWDGPYVICLDCQVQFDAREYKVKYEKMDMGRKTVSKGSI